MKRLFLFFTAVFMITSVAMGQIQDILSDDNIAYYNTLMGRMHYHDGDYAEAFSFFKKAAEQGNAEAQYSLGKCYYNGEGVPEDRQKAVDLFYKAAKQGYVLAQYEVGVISYIHSVETETLFWFNKAADQNYEPAQYMLGRIYYEGSLIEQDYEKSVYYLLLAKKSAEPYISGSACDLLSKCYRNGRGVAQDIRKADELLAEAKAKGCGGGVDVLIEKLKKEFSVAR